MKKLFILSMLIPLAMVCSCQKQDAAAEQQLAQRKADASQRPSIASIEKGRLVECPAVCVYSSWFIPAR
jgi:phosphoenolpyruvate-protein kinase (PTS system EI component)